MNTLSLLIPGLLGPLPEINENPEAIPDCSILNNWLARAELKSSSGKTYFSQLAELFAVPPEYSVAYASAHYDQCDCSEAYWYRADPVHFKADMNHALLFDHQQLGIELNEAQTLVDRFNQHFKEEGLKLVAAHETRWYLQSQKKLNINTTVLGDAIGRNVSHFLPEGDDALNWRRLLNETQMLLHTHPVNEQREDKGQLQINSVWLWGEGKPFAESNINKNNSQDFNWVMTDDAVAGGLAMLSGIECRPLAESVSEFSMEDANGLIVIDTIMGPMNYGDVLAWHDGVMDLCQKWLQPLHSMLKQKKVKQINLYTADGRLFSITANKLLKFWRRPASLNKYMNC